MSTIGSDEPRFRGAVHSRLAVRLAQKNIDLVEMLYLDELKVVS